MDDRTRQTLALILAVAPRAPAQRGRQLVMVARDFAAAGELSTARRVIDNVRDYFTSGRAYLEMRDDGDLRRAMVELADLLGS